ncbi:MAG: rhodanese-like domain-containing protein [Flavobacteriaceae bacterium]|jgi:rhodanese-related sulfurtransferase|nr:rhodanese-like domain-containing protein [Flavobacteriaceae bacterium]MBT6127146.1 rhodanese-like domain-containing protein [Flavobacteriaceae bacterium]MDG1028283.1 rhodanese-like domain-containing protein [Flavobacteriaceae bacterium]MDG1942254.1 rhodanese-like domain-containing protein [Flavobacteriaceae bacterium]|tara:strand:- start:411 stop:716 length:306 start_codon:yes stop_codon:yes gene_type:complete
MDLSQEEWKHKLENDDNAFLLDVRTLEEFEEGHIPNARLLDIRQAGSFMEEIQSMDASKHYYVYCRSGARSAQACQLMGQMGMDTTYNLLGGFMEWDGASA